MSSRILIADDTPVNLKVLSSILAAAGHTPLAATNGQETLDLARREAPDLILLDIMMPGKDGYAVCAELKADPALAEIPVIFLSALQQTADKVKGLELGAVDYVAKPFDRAEVLARISTQLRLRQLTRSLLHANAELQERQGRLEEDLRAAADIQRALAAQGGPFASRRLPRLAFRSLRRRGRRHLRRPRPRRAVVGFLHPRRQRARRPLGDADGLGRAEPGSRRRIVCRREPGSLLARAVPPAEVLSALDREYPFERFERYFTISYLVLEIEGGRSGTAAPPTPLPCWCARTARSASWRRGAPSWVRDWGPPAFEEGQRQLQAGERIFLYTDGIPEFEGPGGQPFGRDAFCRVLQETASLSLDTACERVATGVARVRGGEGAQRRCLAPRLRARRGGMSPGQAPAMEPRAITLIIDSRLENLAPLGIATRAASRELGLDDATRAGWSSAWWSSQPTASATRIGVSPVTRCPCGSSRRRQELEVAVIDEGTPVPVERRAAPPAPQDPIDVQSIAEGGRGIFLVHQLMDTVSYESEGARNVVRLTKAFPASSRRGRLLSRRGLRRRRPARSRGSARASARPLRRSMPLRRW